MRQIAHRHQHAPTRERFPKRQIKENYRHLHNPPLRRHIPAQIAALHHPLPLLHQSQDRSQPLPSHH